MMVSSDSNSLCWEYCRLREIYDRALLDRLQCVQLY